MLLVSHDRTFLDNIVTSTLAFEGDGRIVEYVGGYDDYLRQSRDSGSGIRHCRIAMSRERARAIERWRESGSPTRDSGPDPKRKLSFKERRELESLPAHIEALEAERERLQHESASAAFYKASADHIRAVLARIDAIGPELEAALARWVALEDRS